MGQIIVKQDVQQFNLPLIDLMFGNVHYKAVAQRHAFFCFNYASSILIPVICQSQVTCDGFSHNL